MTSNSYAAISNSTEDETAREKCKPIDAGVAFAPGTYNAVIVAAFGGVRARTSQEVSIKVHPLLLLGLCLPLFVAQFTTIFALRLGMNVSEPVLKDEGEEAVLMRLKYVMVLILQLTNFSLMLDTIRLFVFVTNPLTWVEVKRPCTAEDWGSQWSAQWTHKNRWWLDLVLHQWALAIPCFVSLFLRLLVTYLVCVDSMSIILQARSTEEAVVNGLAITFITELNGVYWGFCTTLFHIEPIDDFVFELRDLKRLWDLRSSEYVQELCPTHWEWIKKVAATVPWLRRNRALNEGIGARRLENMLSFSVLALIYIQQLFVLLYAKKTNVLPMARDVCTLYRWEQGKAQFLERTAKLLVWIINHITIIDINFEESEDFQSIDPAENCFLGGKYFRMLCADRKEIMVDPETAPAFYFGIFCISALTFGPQVARFVWNKVAGGGSLNTVVVQDPSQGRLVLSDGPESQMESASIKALKLQVAALTEQVAALTEQVAPLTEKLEARK